MSPAQLHTLLAEILSGAAGGTQAEWHARIAIVRTSLTHSPHSNWSVEATGTAAQRAAIEQAVGVVRVEHPYITR